MYKSASTIKGNHLDSMDHWAHVYRELSSAVYQSSVEAYTDDQSQQ